MSLRDLGNLSTLLDVFDEIDRNQKANGLKDREKGLKEFIGTAKNFVGEMKLDDAIKHLKMLGLEGDNLREALERIGYKTSEIDDALVKVGKNGANSINKVGDAFKGALAKMGAFFSSAAGFATLALGAFALIGAGIYNQYKAFDRAVAEAEESRTTYQDLTSEIESMNKEFETTESRIKELEALDSPTLAEQDELDKLRIANDLLETQIRLKQNLANYAQQDAAADAANVLTMERKYVTTDAATVTPDGMIIAPTSTRNVLEETKDYYDEIEELTKRRERLYKEQSNLDPSTKAFKKNASEIARLDERISTLTANFTNNLSVIDSAYKSLFDDNGNVIDGYSGIVRDVENFYGSIAEVPTKVSQAAEELKKAFSISDAMSGLTGSERVDPQKAFNDWVDSLSDKELQVAYELRLNTESATWDLREWQEQVDTVLNGTNSLESPFENMTSSALEEERRALLEYIQAIDAYKQICSEAENTGLGASDAQFGNIDLNNRGVVEWNDANISKYSAALDSWNIKADELEGTISTVLGTSASYDGVEIAFSPMLQTSDGAKLLDATTVDQYIWGLIEKAGENWTSEDLFRLDAEGIEVNGLKIKGLIADIGDTALQTAGAMHYFGKDGALTGSYAYLADIAKQAGITVDELIRNYDTYVGQISEIDKVLAEKPEKIKKTLSDLWDSVGFAESKAALVEMAEELDGITPKAIKDLAVESEDLAAILEEDGMNAEFLAHILQKELDGADGFSLITEEMLGLNKALQGAAGMFDEVTKARKRYTDAMNVEEKDEGFKTYAEALKTINEEIAAGTTNSNAFWASAEFLFGEDQLAEWGWGDGIAEIKAGAQDLAGIFGDAESAGTGLLNKMYQMSQAGQLVNENGEKLVDISRNWDGSYDFAIDPSNIAELADQMGIAEEAVLACLEAMSMYGNVHFYNIEEVVSAVDDLGITMDIAGQKVVNLQQLEAHLKATGKSAWYIHEVKKAMEGLDGTTLLDITADTGALLTNIQNLGFATQDGLTFTVNYDNLVAFLSQMKFTEDQVKILTQSLIEADGVTLQSAIGQINDMNEAAVVLSTVEFGTAQDSLDGIVESIDDVDDSSIDNAQSQFEKFRKTCVQINKELLGIASNIGKVNSRSVTTGSTESGSGSGLHQQKPGFAPSAHYASGTLYAKKGAALLGDEYSPNGEPKPELVVSDGGAYLAGVDGPTIGYLQDGDRVYTADETEKILGGKSRIIGSIPAFAVGKNINATNVQDGAAGPRHPDIVINGLGGNTTVVVEPPAKTPATTEEEEQDISPISPDSTPGLTPPNGKFFGNNIPKPESNSGDTGGNNSSVKSDEESEFERLYKEHQHNLAMDRETEEEYLEWLEKAYKEAYEKNEITLDEYRQYEEEVYELQKQIFDDHLKDIEHKIDVLSREPGNEREIISLYQEMIVSIEKEIAAAKARGLDENSDYIQDLESQLYDYKDEIAEIEEEITENAKDAVDELVEYRIDMIKQDLENEKDALNDRLDQLRDFYDEQKQMLQDQYDEEKYLEEQSEKRKTKNEIEAELAQLQFDDSAWAQKRKLELQEELANADKDLKDFERDHALEQAQDLLDKTLEKQEEALQAQIDAIDAKLNDPDALYNQALNDIKNNTGDLYQEMVDYNNAYGSGNPEEIQEMWDNAYKSLEEYMRLFGEAYKDVALVASTGTINTSSTGYASGTKSATPGLHGVDELGPEHVFVSANGKRYRLFNGDEKVLDAKATNFLYNFATSGGSFITEAFGKLIQKVQAFSMEKVSKPTQLIELKAGDIVIQGNATERTVSEIRRAQRDNLDFVMKEFIRLNR